jgi:hypothetical protein
VCQYLSQAADKVKQAQSALKTLADITNESLRKRQQRHIGKTQEWGSLLQGLHQDFSCEPFSIGHRDKSIRRHCAGKWNVTPHTTTWHAVG